MGKHFWKRQGDNEKNNSNNKQPAGCMSGLVHALNYQHWHSNVRRIKRQIKYEPHVITPTSLAGAWSPKSPMFHTGEDEVEKLIDEKENANTNTKGRRASNKRSLRSRIKALISEEISKGSKKLRRKVPSLQRTYSIHHLGSQHGMYDENQIIFLQRNVKNRKDQSMEATNGNEGESLDTQDNTNVLDIFKVDKELFARNLKILDEKSKEAKITKSKSFPVIELSRRRTLKPSKLVDKQREVWFFPEEERFQEVHNAQRLSGSDYSGANANAWDMIRPSHCRTLSSSESLHKYARLFESSNQTNAKLDPSQSLRLTTERYSYRSMSFGRIYSLPNFESYVSDLYGGEPDDDFCVNGSILAAKDCSAGSHISLEEKEIYVPLVNGRENEPPEETWIAEFPDNRLDEDGARLRLTKNAADSEKIGVKEGDEKPEINCEEKHKKLLECSVLDSDTMSPDLKPHGVDFQVSEGFEPGFSHLDELDSSTNSNNSTSNANNNNESDNTLTCFQHDRRPKKRSPDLCYIRQLLDQSGIARVASESMLQESDHPLTLQFFEEFEARWAHEHDQLIGGPDFHGYWHHMMLFHVANEAFEKICDTSLPYYTKALSFSCHIHPFPVGNNIIEAVCSKVSTFEPKENQSLDCIIASDFANSDAWMNLQNESECVTLLLEELIFDEILEELIYS